MRAITELHTLFYSSSQEAGRRKVVPFNISSLLTEKSLAYWAMDDGHKHASGFTFNTSGFTLKDVKLLQAALKENWDLDTSIHSRNRLYINASSPSTKDLFIKKKVKINLLN